MIRKEWTDSEGRKWIVNVPEECPEDMVSLGIPVGPPSLARLGLPLDIEVRLHNQLANRGLVTKRDFEARPRDVVAAIQTAFRVDMQTLHTIYNDES